MAGVAIYTVKELMRHASVKTTERYSHLAPKHLQEAVAKRDPVKVVQLGGTARVEQRELVQ